MQRTTNISLPDSKEPFSTPSQRGLFSDLEHISPQEFIKKYKFCHIHFQELEHIANQLFSNLNLENPEFILSDIGIKLLKNGTFHIINKISESKNATLNISEVNRCTLGEILKKLASVTKAPFTDWENKRARVLNSIVCKLLKKHKIGEIKLFLCVLRLLQIDSALPKDIESICENVFLFNKLFSNLNKAINHSDNKEKFLRQFTEFGQSIKLSIQNIEFLPSLPENKKDQIQNIINEIAIIIGELTLELFPKPPTKTSTPK